MNQLFDIILPTYNNREELHACLLGFESQSIKSARLLICVDGSNDGTIEFLDEYCSQTSMNMMVLRHPDGKNHGRNATRNLVLPHVNATFVICLDSDAIPDPDFLEQHLRILEQGDCISAGDLTYVNADENRWAAYLHTRGKKRFAHMAVIPFQYITTGNLGMPARFFIQLEGQDSAMSGYGGGDTEFAYRLHMTFNPLVYHAKSAIARSFMQKSIKEALDQMEEFGSGNLRYIRAKHPAFTQLFKMNLILGKGIHSMLIRALLHPIFGSITEYLVKVLPIGMSTILLPHAIMSRMLKGYQSMD
jgi:glycosyltransferase involved in cell wall biosynthesis